jgi:hypothetical protein
LKNQGVQLSEKLDCEKIKNDFEDIWESTRQNKYTLPRRYAYVKRIQSAIYDSLVYENDINKFVPLFTIVKAIRKDLGREYDDRRELNAKIRNIQAIVHQNENVPLVS